MSHCSNDFIVVLVREIVYVEPNKYRQIYKSFPFCATMNCVAKNATVMYRYLLLLLIWGLCAASHLTAQTIIQTTAQADSLRRVIATAKHDTTRVSAMNELAYYFCEKTSQYDSAMVWAQAAQGAAERSHFRLGIAAALQNIGRVLYRKSKNTEALEYCFKSLKMNEELGNKGDMAKSLNTIALVYLSAGKSPEAIEYHFKALRIREELGDKNGIASSLNNIANVYKDLGKYTEALELGLSQKHKKCVD
jgi:tetratricopeptide (TPR) repeat protein